MSNLRDKLVKTPTKGGILKKRKKNETPVYDSTTGKLISPGKRKRRRVSLTVILIVVLIMSVIYVPGMFMQDEYTGTATRAVTKADGSAIRRCASAVRNHTEDDFDMDGLSNAEEEKYKTDLWKKDTDGDGVFDTYEINVLRTDPTHYDDKILVDAQTKSDELAGNNLGTPYYFQNVMLWADDYMSKAHGGVVETTRGYRFKDFVGYAKFPEQGTIYAYMYENGVRTLLPHLTAENAWKISGSCTVEIYTEPLTEVVRFSVFGKPFYVPSNIFTDILSLVLPDKGLFTAKNCTSIDADPDTTPDTVTKVVRPAIDTEDEYRFTVNSNTLNDLLYVRKSIADHKSCTAVSLYNKDYGEWIAVVYGYTAKGDLLLADQETLQPIGTLEITEHAQTVMDANGNIKPFLYFDFDGFGFHSRNGDRICFFAASAGNIDIEEDGGFGTEVGPENNDKVGGKKEEKETTIRPEQEKETTEKTAKEKEGTEEPQEQEAPETDMPVETPGGNPAEADTQQQ